MKVKRVDKFDKECPLFIFIYANSKFIVTSKNQDFDSLHNGTRSKEKPSKISNIAVVI